MPEIVSFIAANSHIICYQFLITANKARPQSQKVKIWGIWGKKWKSECYDVKRPNELRNCVQILDILKYLPWFYTPRQKNMSKPYRAYKPGNMPCYHGSHQTEVEIWCSNKNL